MKKLNIRRVLTFIFTLTFIISTVMGTLPAFSLSSDKTDSVVVTSGSYWVSPVKAIENILKNKDLFNLFIELFIF